MKKLTIVTNDLDGANAVYLNGKKIADGYGNVCDYSYLMQREDFPFLMDQLGFKVIEVYAHPNWWEWTNLNLDGDGEHYPEKLKDVVLAGQFWKAPDNSVKEKKIETLKESIEELQQLVDDLEAEKKE